MNANRSRWHWLLWVPIVLPLITPLYNSTEPRLYGIPFFYWSQMALVGLPMVFILLVYQATKERK